MIVNKIAICPICEKKTYLRIEDGSYLDEYPIRVRCMNCRAMIKGTYVMNPQRGLILYNARIEECDAVETKNAAGVPLVHIKNADYVAEISGELPCKKIEKYFEGCNNSTPFIDASDQIDVEARKERLNRFRYNMVEWNRWKNIAFQLLDEGSIDYIATALRNKMGDYDVSCESNLETLHCLQEVVREETEYLFFDISEDETIANLLNELASADDDQISEFICRLGGVDEILSSYKKMIEVFSSFMEIYPNLLPAETFLRFKNKENIKNRGISTCTYEDLKSFYQDSYESILSIYHIPVSIDNIILRNKYYIFNKDEEVVNIFDKPNYKRMKDDYERYKALDNGKKQQKINFEEPIQGLLNLPANKDLRNGIGHNNIKYDGISQSVILYDQHRPGKIKQKIELMDMALDCLGLVKSAVIMAEVLLFLLRKEENNTQAVLHPRFYKKAEPNMKCPCGSGIKYKKCCKRIVESMR